MMEGPEHVPPCDHLPGYTTGVRQVDGKAQAEFPAKAESSRGRLAKALEDIAEACTRRNLGGKPQWSALDYIDGVARAALAGVKEAPCVVIGDGPRKTQPKCGTCFFCQVDGQAKGEGRCHGCPPREDHTFPKVRTGIDWCGEHITPEALARKGFAAHMRRM